MMKVLFLVNIPSPYRVDFFNELGQYCNLTVLYERKQAANREWKVKESKNFNEVYLNGVNIAKDSALSMKVIKFLNPKKYDLIVVGGYSSPTGMLAIQYMKLKKIDFILNCDGGMKKQDKALNYKIKKHFIKSAKAWLSTGEVCDEYLLYYGANKEGIYRYPFTSIYKNDILPKITCRKKKENIKKELEIRYKKVILSVGRFLSWKGFENLIESGKALDDDTGIIIIGGTPTKEYLEIIKKFNIKNIKFLSFMNSEQLKKYYRAADIFVLPTKNDIWGLVINEAMAQGLPIITTTRCGAGLELIKGNGYIVQVDKVDELVNAINMILGDEEKRESMSQKSVKIINEYTIEKMAYKHMKIFEEFIRNE